MVIDNRYMYCFCFIKLLFSVVLWVVGFGVRCLWGKESCVCVIDVLYFLFFVSLVYFFGEGVSGEFLELIS